MLRERGGRDLHMVVERESRERRITGEGCGSDLE